MPSSRIQEKGNGSDGPDLSWTTVAAAVASSLGVLGFVVFVGGALLWARFKRMGLPAEHALALVPKAELVATGARFLAPAVLLAALVTLITAVIRKGLQLPLKHLPTNKEQLKIQVVSPKAAAVLLSLLLLATEVTIAVFALATIPGLIFVLLAAIATVLSLAVGLVYAKHKRGWSLAVFLALGTFWLGVSYAKTSYGLEVLPMAYSRAPPGKVTFVERAYFVTETSDRIYFASTPQAHGGPNELRDFPRAEADDVEVGELTPAKQAPARAARFALNLCDRLAALVPLAPAKGQAPSCNQRYLDQLTATQPRRDRENHAR